MSNVNWVDWTHVQSCFRDHWPVYVAEVQSESLPWIPALRAVRLDPHNLRLWEALQATTRTWIGFASTRQFHLPPPIPGAHLLPQWDQPRAMHYEIATTIYWIAVAATNNDRWGRRPMEISQRAIPRPMGAWFAKWWGTDYVSPQRDRFDYAWFNGPDEEPGNRARRRYLSDELGDQMARWHDILPVAHDVRQMLTVSLIRLPSALNPI